MSVYFELALHGGIWGSLYILDALGLNLIYGVMKVLNIAHGEVVMLGAYATYWLFTLAGISPPLGLRESRCRRWNRLSRPRSSAGGRMDQIVKVQFLVRHGVARDRDRSRPPKTRAVEEALTHESRERAVPCLLIGSVKQIMGDNMAELLKAAEPAR